MQLDLAYVDGDDDSRHEEAPLHGGAHQEKHRSPVGDEVSDVVAELRLLGRDELGHRLEHTVRRVPGDDRLALLRTMAVHSQKVGSLAVAILAEHVRQVELWVGLHLFFVLAQPLVRIHALAQLMLIVQVGDRLLAPLKCVSGH